MSRHAGAITLAFALTSVAVSASAADPKKDAQTLFEIAVKQADAGDNAAALSSFRAAYEKYPSFKVLYNIGKVCARMGDAPCAVRNYEQYLRDGDKDVPKARRKEVEAEIRALSRTLATVTLKSNLIGGEVTIDDVVVGKVPLGGPLPVAGGTHKIAVTHEGNKLERSITIVAGESTTLVLDADKEKLAAAPAPPPAVEKPEKEEPSPEPAHASLTREPEQPKSFPVVPWAITGGLAAGTILTGILAASAYGTYKDKKGEFPISRDDLDSAQGTARDLFVLSSVLGACTVIGAGIATYFTLSSPTPGSGPPPSKARIGFGFGPGGVSVRGLLP